MLITCHGIPGLTLAQHTQVSQQANCHTIRNVKIVTTVTTATPDTSVQTAATLTTANIVATGNRHQADGHCDL